MNEKQLNEKESLELITQMIKNTRQKLEKEGSGNYFLVWGYTTIAVSLAVWYLLTTTGNYHWNWLWLAIPVIGYSVMLLTFKKKEKYPRTYIEKVISYVWIVLGISCFFPSIATLFVYDFPILFMVILLISIGTAITGLIIRFTPLSIAGFVGMFLSILCLLLINTDEVILVFAGLFLVIQVIPGHILNYKSRKKNV